MERTITMDTYVTMIRMFMTTRPPANVADPNIRNICSEFAAMLAYMGPRFDDYYFCVAEVHGAHMVLSLLPVLDAWKERARENKRIVAPNGEDLEPYLKTAADKAMQHEYSFFKLEVSSYNPNIALMLFEKSDVHWVAHRYGISIHRVPLKMMRLCKKYLSDNPGYNASATDSGFDWSWCLTATMLLALTMRKDECDGCGASCDQLLKCARCGSVRYCSKACQKAHWKEEHKADCTAGGAGVTTGTSDYFDFRAKYLGLPEGQGAVKMCIASAQ